MALLDKAKAVCRVTNTTFDGEITDLIGSAFDDLGITNISEDILTESDAPALVIRAVLTYVNMNFKLSNAQITTDVYDRLKESYDEQKSQLLMSTTYNDYEEEE